MYAATKNLARATKIASVTTIALGTLLFILSFTLWGLFSGLWMGLIIFWFLIPAANAEYGIVEAVLAAKDIDGEKGH